MGLISKIEDKLSGNSSSNKNNNETSKLENQAVGQEGNSYSSQNAPHHGVANESSRAQELRHPVASAKDNTGSGITGGTAVSGIGSGSGPTLSGTQGVTGGGYGREGNNISSTTAKLRDTHLGGNTTSASTADHSTPRQPYDPYSSKGQQIAANAADNRNEYGASQNRAQAGDVGSRTYADSNAIQRTQDGGITNGTNSQTLHSGPHSHLENRNAVPTAGGQKLGTGTTGSSADVYDPNASLQSQSQNRHGREAAAVGALGAGAGTYGAEHHRHATEGTNHGSGTTGSSGDSYDPYASSPTQPQHHYGRDAAAGGLVGAGAYSAEQHHHQGHDSRHEKSHVPHHSQTTTSSINPIHQSHDNYPSTAQKSYEQQPQQQGSSYAQGTSYMNRPPADQPLAQSQDFTDRHPQSTSTGIGAGASALGADATHIGHQQPYDTTTQRKDVSSYITPAFGSTTGSNLTGTSHPGNATSSTGSSAAATKGISGLEMAKKLGGAYEAGYRDALAHMEVERQSSH